MNYFHQHMAIHFAAKPFCSRVAVKASFADLFAVRLSGQWQYGGQIIE